jgi:AraC-like DNA-binding protein
LVSAQVLVVAAALVRAPRNRVANRLLAALLSVVVGLITPFAIGFAGFYDRWPWLSFAPFAVSLAVGPLVYGYANALVGARWPGRFAWHLAPASIQFGYQSVCFALPLAAKSRWDRTIHEPFIDPAIGAATLVSLAAYSLAALSVLRRYRTGLGDVVSDERRYAADWLGRSIGAMIVVLVVWWGYQAWEFVFGRLSYFDIFGLYLVLAAVAVYLAVEGWRHADLRFPSIQDDIGIEPSRPAAPVKDWQALGEAWAARTRADEWWREPDLSLPTLAARLGVNTHYLSRGLNEGLGVNFAGLVNAMRSQAVARALEAGTADDLLGLALDAGFNSKASFNRAFKAEFGVSPSVYRASHGSKSRLSAAPLKSRREKNSPGS